MTRKKVVNILKWLWIAATITGAGFYFYTNFNEISVHLSSVSLIRLGLSFLFLLLGKLLVADITRLSMKQINHNMTYLEAITITSVTQLGKYLPGGIWHFAGKFGVYKARGIPGKKATQAMIWENGWLLSSAAVIGGFTLLITSKETVCSFLPFICKKNIAGTSAVLIPILWISVMLIFERVFFKKKNIRITDFMVTMTEQILVWISFGLSLWMVFPPSSVSFANILGVFSISWVAGYAAVFAPGGIGIRELLLTMLLGNLFSNFEVTTYATLHRVLWVIIEVILGAGTALLFGMPTGENSGRSPE